MKKFLEAIDDTFAALVNQYGVLKANLIAIMLFPVFLVLVIINLKNR